MGLYKELLDIITSENYVFISEKNNAKAVSTANHTTILDGLKAEKPVLHLYKMCNSSYNLCLDKGYSYKDLFPVETYHELFYINDFGGVVKRDNKSKRHDVGFKLKYKYSPSKDIKFYSTQSIITTDIRLGVFTWFKSLYDPTDVSVLESKYIYKYYIKIGDEDEEVSFENISKILDIINKRYTLYKDVQYWLNYNKSKNGK